MGTKKRSTHGDEKMRELILHISLRSITDRHFGATKLDKLLFWSDFTCYYCTGQSITGQDYQHLPHGPAPQRLVPIRDRLIEEGALAIAPDSGAMSLRRPVALRPPNLDVFSAEEIATVDSLIDRFRRSHGTQMSAYSHEFVGWKLTAIGEKIPYYSALFTPAEELTEEERKYGMDALADYQERQRA